MKIKKATSISYGTPRFFFYLGLLTIGQTVFRPALTFTASDWFFLISCLLTMSESLLRRNIRIKFTLYITLGIFLFTIGGIISSSFSKNPFISFIALNKYLYLIAVWFWLSNILLQKLEHIQTSIVLWTSSAALSGLGAVMQLIWGDIIPGTSPAWSRMTGLTEHVNDLGGLTSVALIPALMMLIYFQKSFLRIAYSTMCTLLIAGGLILSISMSGITALLISMLVWVLLSRITLKNLLIIGIATTLFITAIAIQSRYDGVSIISRLYDINNDGFSTLTFQTRMDTNSAAWKVISDTPLLGVGLGSELGLTKTGYVVHNIFLLNWFESGLLGLLGILMILGSIAFEAYKGIRAPRQKKERILGIALFSSYIAFLVLGMAQPIYYKRFGWISAALLMALYSKRKGQDNQKGIYVASHYIDKKQTGNLLS